MDERCETCRFWKPVPADDYPQLESEEEDLAKGIVSEPSRDLNAVAARSGWGECELTRMDTREAVHRQSKAVARDHEGYKAELLTAPDFGCVQYRSKEAGAGSP